MIGLGIRKPLMICLDIRNLLKIDLGIRKHLIIGLDIRKLAMMALIER